MFIFVSMFYSIPDSSVLQQTPLIHAKSTNETRAFSAMDDHVESSVLRTIKTKTVRIKSLFSQVRKFLSHIPVTCKSLRI